MGTPPPEGSWQAQNPHLADPTPAQVAWQATGGKPVEGPPIRPAEWARNYQARQQAWRRRWLPVLLVLAVIFGVLSFLTFARP